jgi:hypothetical protein
MPDYSGKARQVGSVDVPVALMQDPFSNQHAKQQFWSMTDHELEPAIAFQPHQPQIGPACDLFLSEWAGGKRHGCGY